MDAPLDAPTPLEAHEAVPVERLLPWLARHLGVTADRVELGRYGRGFSNLTFRVRAGAHDLVLRRGPPGVRIASAHDMLREARVIAGVGRVWDKVPRVVATCDDPEVLGGPFFLMERLDGVILRDRPPRGLALGPEVMARLSDAMVRTLAGIHGLDAGAAGLADLGRPEGYVARQVEGWSGRWARARTDDVPDMTWLVAWLARTRPPEAGAALVHNDFKYDNVLLDPEDVSRVRAVLDWEMATRGDPLLDLGTALAWWIQADDPPGLQVFRVGPTHLPGNLTRRELVRRYGELTGRGDLDATWYFVFGLFKNAVVAQQLHARHARGLSDDPRFAALGAAVRAVAAVAREAAETGRVDGLGR